jgi:hypothetical protein
MTISFHHESIGVCTSILKHEAGGRKQMDKEKMLYSYSENLPVSDIRKLKEMSKSLDLMLNQEEFLKIVSIYNECIERILKEKVEVV